MTGGQWAGWAVVAVAGYLLGSIPVAVIVGRRHGVDPRRRGDRNPGYWNTKDALGRRAALPVFVGDTAKGTAAGLVGLVAGDAAGLGRGAVYGAVAAAMVGHAWPVFARFAGGRSILTFAGGMAVVSPLTFAVCVALCVAVTVGWTFAYGARVAIFAVPVVQAVVDGWRWGAATFALMALIGLRFAQAALRQRTRSRPSDPPAPGSDQVP